MKNLSYVGLVLAGVAIFLYYQKVKRSDPVSERPVVVNPAQPVHKKENTPAAAPAVAQQIQSEVQNPAPSVGPKIAVGSWIKVEYKIRNAKTAIVIAESGKDKLPTDFEIGKPNVFGNLLMKLIGANKGALLKLILPPQFGTLTPTGQQFAKTHALPNDTVLQIEFTVLEVIPKK